MQAFYATIHQIVNELIFAETFGVVLYDEARQLMNVPYDADPLNVGRGGSPGMGTSGQNRFGL